MAPFRRPSQKERRSHDSHREQNHYEWQQGEPEKYIMTFPIHPLPSMQAPFEESMLDATGETGHIPFPNPNKSIEARQQLLCRDVEASELSWNFTYNCHWRNNPKGKFHPLQKTIAQIIFGVHLLHQHLEKSVADVADILLKHVNELDSFLQRANEDIEGSLKDMLFRRKCLKVPMEHVNEFDRLLEDRMYRAQLLDGNVVIERTINRMSEMLNDYLVDMSTFRDASNELDMYLLSIGEGWTYENEDVGRIYSAMCGNTAGWAHFLQSLVAKAEKLGVVLVQVSSYCNEIEKRCGAASRRSLSEYYQGPPRGHDRPRFDSRDDSDSTLRADRHHPEHETLHDSAANDAVASKRATMRDGKGDHSPPLTGKDSAYSSISGGSFASPTAAHPRSASSQSSYPRPQFGLFPSSNPSTPKQSMSGRHGAMSPAPSLLHPDQRAQLPPRASTSLDNHGPSGRRLLKKTSLSSLKRLFSKRKHPVDTIAE
ncbi:hypothetical protein BS50DRAFT_501444 [Corynespora cassiicola Philippines]|uniref:Uncharacterized protein n=1 Tax=Corynespora cassiicola Philippines TaxID=1448308 RepID=A0A2T2NAA4_CORCC|nr:hypothetical protein BS50DRAFT_501444 [Corynespora cassiicola Philippines]